LPNTDPPDTNPTDELEQISRLPPLPAEQMLIETLPEWDGERAIVISPGRAQLADHLLIQRRMPQVTAWFYDLYDASQARQVCTPEVEVACATDLPDGEIDLVAMPVLRRGEVELTRELLQQGHERLVPGGYLATSVDNPKDRWLHEQMQVLFDKVTCVRDERGAAYWGRKTKPLKKHKDFRCQFAFRDEEQRLIQVVSRPGVFSHRRLDPGARQLMLAVEIGPEDAVLDMGCGAGPVALFAAFQTTGPVYAVDANARAIECTRKGAEINALPNVQAILNADGEIALPEPVDLALANPPYFGNERISQHFVDTAVCSLRPGGALLVVTKQPSWYEACFESLLEDVVVFESSRYHIACGRKPA
jgi:16S rRNA G1207 methylase RsmC